MENKKREIAKFYEQMFLDTKLKEKLEEKAKVIVTEEDLRNLIREEIMPLMKKFKVNFSEEELLEYEEETLKKLSKEDLDNVSGGVSIKSTLLTGGLLSMALLGGVGPNSSIANAESGKGSLVQTEESGQTQRDDDEEEDDDELEEGFFYAYDNNGFRYECCNFETFFNHFKEGKHGHEVKEDTLKEIDWTAFEKKIFISLDSVNIYEKKWKETHGQNWENIREWVIPSTLNVNGKDVEVGGITCNHSERIFIKKLFLSKGINDFIFDNYCFNLPWGWMATNKKVSKLEKVDFSNVNGQLILGQNAFNESKIESVTYSPNLKNLVALQGAFCDSKLKNINFTAKKIYLENSAFSNSDEAEKVEFSSNCKDVKIKGVALFGPSCRIDEVNVPVCNFTSGPEENDGVLSFCEAKVNYPKDFSGDFSIKQGNRGLFSIAGTINCPQNVNNFIVEDEALSVQIGIGNNLINFIAPKKIRGNADIGEEAFKYCKIASFNIDDCDGDINVGKEAVEYNKLKSINLNSNNGNINIGSEAFCRNEELEEITLSAAHDINIDKKAFYNCKNTKKINICCKGNVNIDISNFYNLYPDLEINIRAKNLSFKNAEKIFKVDAENYLWEKHNDGNGSSGRKFCKKVVFNGFDFTAKDLFNNKFKIDNNNDRQKALRTSLEMQLNTFEPTVSPELRTEWVQAKNSNRLMVIGTQVYTIKPNSSGKVTLDKLVGSFDEKTYTYSLTGALQDGSWVKVENDNHPDFIKANKQIKSIKFGPGLKEISFENDTLKNNKNLTDIDLSNAIDLEQVNCGPNAFTGTAITSFWFPKQDVRFNADSSAFEGTPIAKFDPPSTGLFFSESIQKQATRALNCLKSCNKYKHLFNSILDKNSIKNLATVLNNIKNEIKPNSETEKLELPGTTLTSNDCQKLIDAAEIIGEYVE